ncbi:hypothetical protein CASFOL_014916 [Castilleja foliolosa]|uniref:TOG domain-containing protein n=1 Tax=Castilleja foliolosa TaxID=1961234 RepID=A0ABD3DCT4_9LAMI
MSSQRSTKPSKPPNQTAPSRSSSSVSSSPSPSLSSHLAMVELKQRILTSLSKLSDRDTHQIAVEDLEKIITSLSNDGISMLLNCLYDAVNDPKIAVKKEGVRLLAALCAAHTDAASTHLTKIIAHTVRRLKDSDSQIREACRDAVGSLAGLYLKGSGGGDSSVVSLFVKPLFEVMNENNKAAQGGAALCLAKMVECASDPPLNSFQKLCTRVCKYLNSSSFMAKASLLHVVSSLSQVGAIAPHNLETLLQSIHECLGSPDWAIRKAAAETLIVLSSNGNITAEGAASTLNMLEACRFDKIKPVRESMNEALQHWKKIAGKGDGSSDENKVPSHDGDKSESADPSDRKDPPNSVDRESAKSLKGSSHGSSPKNNIILDKAVGILKKKAPGLTDKELNPEFFQKLETRVTDDLPVEVIVPPRSVNPSNSQNGEELESSELSERTRLNCQAGDGNFRVKREGLERGAVGDRGDYNQREPPSTYPEFSRNPGHSDGFMNNKGNWMGIQRQLLLLERQQAHLMNMLQDFMGGSHDSMVTLEDRVRGLERVVEDMARDLSISSGRRGGGDPRFESSSNRSLGKYNNGFSDYSNGKLARGGEGRMHFGERFAAFDGLNSGMKGRGPSWRSDGSDSWEFHYGKNGQMGSRRGPIDIRSGKSELENDQVGSRRAWEKGAGPVRFGEGPSARSVWQASKDEATLEAIRVAGDDNGVTRSGARVAMPEMTAEALGDDGGVQDRDPVWTAWSNAMDALHVGDTDNAFAEVLGTGDDALLVKIMERSGPVIDQLSNEVASEVVNAISQLIMEQNLFDMCLYWVQQLTDIVMENGPDVLGIPMEVRREILLNLHDASSSIELPEDWEGSPPEQLLFQLASAWEIDLEHLGK